MLSQSPFVRSWMRLRAAVRPSSSLSGNPRPSRRPRPRLGVEHLEGRDLPSATSLMAGLHHHLSHAGRHREVQPPERIQVHVRQAETQGTGGSDVEHHRQGDNAAKVTTTTRFTAIAGASFLDLPATDVLTPVSFGSVTITANNRAAGSFTAFPTGTKDTPGSGDGYVSFNQPSLTTSPLTLNFSSPVAAFGVSFMHMPSDRLGGNLTAPAMLKVYDGPNGTGHLLGTVTSSGFVASINPQGHQSFVAVMSDGLNIKSAVLSGTGTNQGFGVDGYAASLTRLNSSSNG